MKEEDERGGKKRKKREKEKYRPLTLKERGRKVRIGQLFIAARNEENAERRSAVFFLLISRREGGEGRKTRRLSVTLPVLFTPAMQEKGGYVGATVRFVEWGERRASPSTPDNCK